MTEKNVTEHQTIDNTPEKPYKRKIATIFLSGFFLVIGLVWAIYWFIWGRFELFVDDAYVNGNMVQLMPQIAGTVTEVNTEEAQLVAEGQIVIQLDKTNYSVALQRAQADLAQTVRQVRQYYEHAIQAQQKILSDKANLLKAQLDLKRRTALLGNRAVSREELQHYKTALEAAQANYNASLHQLDAALALVDNTHLYQHPLVEAAKANFKMAYLNYQRTSIRAPISGYIAKRNVQPGQQVSMNSVMLAIIPLNETWVDANYKESALNAIRVNQPVTLYADAYPGFTYHGKVVGLNAGTGATFSLLPPQNASGNWIKIVQRLPVRIQLNTDDLAKNPLQLGLSMRVTIDIHNTKGNRMQKITGNKISYKTDIYSKELAHIEPLIQRIMQANSPDMFLPRARS